MEEQSEYTITEQILDKIDITVLFDYPDLYFINQELKGGATHFVTLYRFYGLPEMFEVIEKEFSEELMRFKTHDEIGTFTVVVYDTHIKVIDDTWGNYKLASTYGLYRADGTIPDYILWLAGIKKPDGTYDRILDEIYAVLKEAWKKWDL
jgi:hypothetical protein